MSSHPRDLSGCSEERPLATTERDLHEPPIHYVAIGGSLHGRAVSLHAEDNFHTCRVTGEIYRVVSEAPDGRLVSYLTLAGLTREEELRLRAELFKA